jgi:hypothetical protein
VSPRSPRASFAIVRVVKGQPELFTDDDRYTKELKYQLDVTWYPEVEE